jgi:hypothetical protein
MEHWIGDSDDLVPSRSEPSRLLFGHLRYLSFDAEMGIDLDSLT